MVVGKRIDNEFVIICSNAKTPKAILKTYRRRWCVETCFRNMKKKGFNLESTHMIDLDRLAKLMAIVALAILIANLAGVKQQCPFKQTVKTALYSVFTRGLRFLKSSLADFDIATYFLSCLAFIKSEG